jgi:CDP-2,3-bis-(O-geranylgeranyl)-sn-glycerol synthase
LIEAFILILVANGTPVIASRLLAERFNWPVDGGQYAPDGNRWLGRSKTFRGVVLAVIATALMAALIGISWQTGAMAGLLAMLGDLLSSFTKRRMGRTVSSQLQGLDQVPESLFPLVFLAGPLNLQWYEVLVLVGAFWVLELLLSRVLFRLHIRNRPY